MQIDLEDLLQQHMRKGGNYVPARLQAALALLERLREEPALSLESHKKPNSAGLLKHETYGSRALERFGLNAVNKNHGRRSCDVGGWGQHLLDIMSRAGFESMTGEAQGDTIHQAQVKLAATLQTILDQEPLQARTKGRTAESIIREILEQAESKGKSGEVAQYLVAAKLQLRLDREIPLVGYNKGDRKSHADLKARTGDFEIENATIEVALGRPDEKHLEQIADALEDSDVEVWLLTRYDRVAMWHSELCELGAIDRRRVVVTSVEAFVGQNITELGEFSSRGKSTQLAELFRLYNERWVGTIGTPGIRIIIK